MKRSKFFVDFKIFLELSYFCSKDLENDEFIVPNLIIVSY